MDFFYYSDIIKNIYNTNKIVSTQLHFSNWLMQHDLKCIKTMSQILKAIYLISLFAHIFVWREEHHLQF